MATDELDADLDGYLACSDYVDGGVAGILGGDDCAPADDARSPGTVELCDGLVNGCGLLPDAEADADGDGWLACEGDLDGVDDGDCDDADPMTHPGADEICDGVRNDCGPEGVDAGAAVTRFGATEIVTYATLDDALSAVDDGDSIQVCDDQGTPSDIRMLAAVEVSVVGIPTSGFGPRIAGTWSVLGGSLEFADLTLTPGPGVSGSGGVAHVAGGDLSLTRVEVECDGTVMDEGGAIRAVGAVVLTDTLFEGCRADAGGAIYSEGALNISGGVFRGNVATDVGGSGTGGRGGALFATEAAEITGTRFAQNMSDQDGGALHVAGGAELVEVVLLGNTAGGNVGAVWAGASLRLTSTRFDGNVATLGGGAVSGPSITSTNSTFENNQALSGGAIDGFELDLTGGELARNLAMASGGAVDLDESSDSRLVLTGVVFRENEAQGGAGGAVRAGGEVDVDGCDFFDNESGSDGGALRLLGPDAAVVNSDFRGNHSIGFGGAVSFANSARNFRIEGSTLVGGMAEAGGAVFSATGLGTIETSLIENNTSTAGSTGGGLHVIGGPAPFTLTDVTLRDNTAIQYAQMRINMSVLSGVVIERTTPQTSGASEIGLFWTTSATDLVYAATNQVGPTTLIAAEPLVVFDCTDCEFGNDGGAVQYTFDSGTTVGMVGGLGTSTCSDSSQSCSL